MKILREITIEACKNHALMATTIVYKILKERSKEADCFTSEVK